MSNSQTFVPRKSIITHEGIQYYTLLDLNVDILNSVANYTYVMYEINQIPSLVTSYGVVYDLYADNLFVGRNGLAATYKLQYKTTEIDNQTTTCKMEIAETESVYDMTNDGESFILNFSDNRVIPKGELTYFFTISHPTLGLISQYSTKLIFRKSLDDFTMSNSVADGTTLVIYDIPVIRKDYYDKIDQRVFELQVLQKLLTTLSFKDYRMLTDFINFKFSNTTGTLNNMQLNTVSLPSVIDILQTPPTFPENGDRYLVDNGVDEWEGQDNNIATYSTSNDGTTSVWYFTKPNTEQLVFVREKVLKYIYGDQGWTIPRYTIPLKISIDVFPLSTYTGSISNLSNAIKDSLMTEFSARFGINANIYRSEIIDVVQEVDGVKHCRLLKPESSIFFNFNIDNFSQEQLLQYSPEYVYFTKNDITIRIL